MMPFTTLKPLQSVDITTQAESEHRDTSSGPSDHDGHLTQIYEPAALSASSSNTFNLRRPSSGDLYTFQLLSGTTVPINQSLFSQTPGLGSGLNEFQPHPWDFSATASACTEDPAVSTGPFSGHNSTAPPLPGMSKFEPIMANVWPSVARYSSVPRASTSSSSKTQAESIFYESSLSLSPAFSKRVWDHAAGQLATSQKPSRAELRRRNGKRAEEPLGKGKGQPSRVDARQRVRRCNWDQRSNPSSGTSTDASLTLLPPNLTSTAGSYKEEDPFNVTTTTGGQRHIGQGKSVTAAGSNRPVGAQRLEAPRPPQRSETRARNRAAANRCRAKSKVAVADLEVTERALSSEHHELTQAVRRLKDEVLVLKNMLLMHGNCDDSVIQQYLANSARMVGSGVAGTTVDLKPS